MKVTNEDRNYWAYSHSNQILRIEIKLMISSKPIKPLHLEFLVEDYILISLAYLQNQIS